ncbi:MAG: 4Fe-4S dicluster domain-containing protein [Candidatus Lokiarchaeota archaeon]|nr:4Fe-4S dicluster domain-containing protein [Candidatus Lokiarchaeota archaeon]
MNFFILIKLFQLNKSFYGDFLMTEVDHYENVRRKMRIGQLGTPKHKKTIEFLKVLYDDEEIELLDNFERGYQLLSPAKLAKKAGWDKDKVKNILKRLGKRGAIFHMGGNYGLINLVPGFFEHYILTRGDSEENTIKVAEYLRWAFLNLTPQMFNNMDPPIWLPKLPYDAEDKLIEIDEAIPLKDQQVFTGEMVRELINKNDYFAKVYCQCREVGELTGNPCEIPRDLGCLLCGLTAKIGVDAGWAEEIPTKEDAIKYTKECEKAGLVHYGMNMGAITFICNCCRCHCCGLAGMAKIGVADYGKSNFQPKWNPELCIFCDKCVKVCPMEAILHQHPVKDENDKMIYNLQNCLGCGLCAANCPKEAITLVKVRTNPTPEMGGIGKQIQEGLTGK